MNQGASPSEVDRLVELTEVTKAYAQFGSGKSRGLRLLPGAVVSLLAAAALLVSPRWGYLVACLAPVTFLVGPSLWKGPYQRFGHVEPFSYAKPASPWPVWVVSALFWVGAVVQLLLRRPDVAVLSRPAFAATAAMLLALALLAPLVRRTADPRDAYAAALGAFFLPQWAARPVLLPLYLAVIGIVMIGFARHEHRRFRDLETRMARLRERS